VRQTIMTSYALVLILTFAGFAAADDPQAAGAAAADKTANKGEAKQDQAVESAKEDDDDAGQAAEQGDAKQDATSEAAGDREAKKGAEQAPKIFDESADARQQIDQALRSAQNDKKQVLLVFGHNWCDWCRKLHTLFQDDATVRERLTNDYVVAWIDTGQLRQHAGLEKKYSSEVSKHGVPFFAVLAGDGTVVKLQETGPFEKEGQHDPEKVASFLQENMPVVPTAEMVLAEARGRAGVAGKAVLVCLSTPTCNWCRRLEAFLAAHADEFARDYVIAPIDIARMSEGREVARRLGIRSGSGVPWMAVVSPGGDVLITSEGPRGNIGYPIDAREIAHFVDMLKKTARHSTPEEIAKLEAALREEGEKIAATLKRPSEASGSAAASKD